MIDQRLSPFEPYAASREVEDVVDEATTSSPFRRVRGWLYLHLAIIVAAAVIDFASAVPSPIRLPLRVCRGLLFATFPLAVCGPFIAIRYSNRMIDRPAWFRYTLLLCELVLAGVHGAIVFLSYLQLN